MSLIHRLFQLILIGLVKLYRFAISPFLSPSCRFAPTCSEYALDGLRSDGIKALPKIIKRILRCHPLGSSGFDPYPTDRNDKIDNQSQSKQ